MNHPTISDAIEASARDEKFALIILPADRVPAAIAEARTAADSAHLEFYEIPTTEGVDVLACPEGEDWSWRVEILLSAEVAPR